MLSHNNMEQWTAQKFCSNVNTHSFSILIFLASDEVCFWC